MQPIPLSNPLNTERLKAESRKQRSEEKGGGERMPLSPSEVAEYAAAGRGILNHSMNA